MKSRKVRSVPDGRIYQLDTPSAVGGEAFIHPVRGEPSLLAKIYIKQSDEQAAKLNCMLANTPKNPTEAQKHRSYAWPTTLISPENGGPVIGFLMPCVTGMKEIFDFYNPSRRLQTCPHFNYRYLQQTARNVAGIMSEVHSKGYVIGDVNQKNILVSDTALVTLLDTDSFQIRDPQTGFLYLCRVRTDGFIAPEAIFLDHVERNVEQDLFGLGVLIFHLLMDGIHPFDGRYLGPGEPLHRQARVIGGYFPYGPQHDYEPMPSAPPFEMLNDDIRRLFNRCFVEGHRAPSARPQAKEWVKALSKASQELTVCPLNEHHYYSAHLAACPWHARMRRGLPDPFPEKVEVKKPKRSRAAQKPDPTPQPAPTHPPTPSQEPTSFLARHKFLVAVIVALILLYLLT